MALLHEHIEGKYEILEKLREGGMGAIYKVRHRLLDEVRVVKVIRSHMVPDGENGERFLREAKVAIRLRHPNIAVLHDFAIADDGKAFIVMEYIDGLNLLDILQGHGPLPISLALEVARQSLRSLGYLHRQRIVHRDVSPDNLMLTRDVDGRALVKLIDLGIAKAIEGGGSGEGGAPGLTTTGIFLGKPRYASPEQFGVGGLDARSDLYSFGVVLYELLTGRCPITGQDPASFMAGHLLRPPVPFETTDPQGRIPGELREAIFRALAKKADERYASAEDFVWALTLMQDRFPLTGDELDTVFETSYPALTRPVPLPLPGQGSTQDRLDREFLMTLTPPPRTDTRIEPATLRLTEIPGGLALVPPAAPAPAAPPAVDHDATRIVASAGRQREESLLDATWLSVPRTEPSAPPEPEPEETGSHSTVRAALVAGAVVLLGLAGWFGWRALAPKPEPPVEEITAPIQTAVIEDPVPADPVASLSPTPAPTPAATPTQAETLVKPSPAPAPARSKPREVAPEDQAVVVNDVDVIGPMQPGDLIRGGLPNVMAPEPKQMAAYAYPEAARGSGRKASVRVRVLVDENGQVVEARIRDSGGPDFDEVALEAARKTTFHPATRDDIPGKMWTELIFEFGE